MVACLHMAYMRWPSLAGQSALMGLCTCGSVQSMQECHVEASCCPLWGMYDVCLLMSFAYFISLQRLQHLDSTVPLRGGVADVVWALFPSR